MLNPGVWLIVINSMLVSLSSALFKLGSAQLSLRNPRDIIRNKWIVAGVALAPLIFILNVNAYRFGDVSALHPLLQLSLVWSALLAMVIFKERLSTTTWLGSALILGGAVLITASV